MQNMTVTYGLSGRHKSVAKEIRLPLCNDRRIFVYHALAYSVTSFPYYVKQRLRIEPVERRTAINRFIL